MSGIELKKLWDAICKNDDEAAFEALFGFFYPKLLRFACELVQVKEVAEELVSDIFVKLWNNRKARTDIIYIKKYLYTAVRNSCLNYLRDYPGYYVLNDEEGSLVNTQDPSQEAEWKELLHIMDKTVAALPPQCRTVFKLIKEEGFKYKEVAEILHVSPRTVETQLVRAIDKLRITLNAYLSADAVLPNNKRTKALKFINGWLLM